MQTPTKNTGPGYLGIDPGLDGFLAMIKGGKVYTWAMPTLKIGKNKRAMDLAQLATILASVRPSVTLALIEKQQVLPNQGAVSGFKTGYGYGVLRMALTGLGIRHEEIAPATWKKSMGLTSAGKTAKDRKAHAKGQAIQKCLGLYPSVDLRATEKSMTPHDGKAEAILLATLAMRKAGGA
jgi:Holliday junction resolvasome RuvABC endonuclease subunit